VDVPGDEAVSEIGVILDFTETAAATVPGSLRVQMV
jgi:hypothetical protein